MLKSVNMPVFRASDVMKIDPDCWADLMFRNRKRTMPRIVSLSQLTEDNRGDPHLEKFADRIAAETADPDPFIWMDTCR
jgi:ABC-type Zn uptake system ZnuABC Zn-binding protein ZnuA